jgi:hypothetical protein
MKTRLINFRVEEDEFLRIKRVSEAMHKPVTEMIRAGLALFMSAAAAEPAVEDPNAKAFKGLLASGKVSPLTPAERKLVAEYRQAKATGTLRTVDAETVLAGIDAALKGRGTAKAGPEIRNRGRLQR